MVTEPPEALTVAFVGVSANSVSLTVTAAPPPLDAPPLEAPLAVLVLVLAGGDAELLLLDPPLLLELPQPATTTELRNRTIRRCARTVYLRGNGFHQKDVTRRAILPERAARWAAVAAASVWLRTAA
jgi:hypothetical protein